MPVSAHLNVEGFWTGDNFIARSTDLGRQNLQHAPESEPLSAALVFKTGLLSVPACWVVAVLMTLVCHTAVLLQSLTHSDPFSQYSLESLWGLRTVPQGPSPCLQVLVTTALCPRVWSSNPLGEVTLRPEIHPDPELRKAGSCSRLSEYKESFKNHFYPLSKTPRTPIKLIHSPHRIGPLEHIDSTWSQTSSSGNKETEDCWVLSSQLRLSNIVSMSPLPLSVSLYCPRGQLSQVQAPGMLQVLKSLFCPTSVVGYIGSYYSMLTSPFLPRSCLIACRFQHIASWSQSQSSLGALEPSLCLSLASIPDYCCCTAKLTPQWKKWNESVTIMFTLGPGPSSLPWLC